MTTGLPSADEIRGLGAGETLAAVVEARRDADRAEARLLALAVHHVDLHPDLDTGLGSAPERPLAGPGTPGVAEFAVEELGAALGMSYAATSRLVAEAVELCFRLPRLWELVMTGRLQAWRARAVAALTGLLSRPAVAFVDRHVAVVAVRNTVPTTGRLRELVHEALLQHDPELAEGLEQAALDGRDVWFEHREGTGVSRLAATLDTLDALDLQGTVNDLAAAMGRLGDVSPIGVRRSRALGSLADPQRTLDLYGDPRPALVTAPEAPAEPSSQSPVPSAIGPAREPGWNRTRVQLYVHLNLADLAALAWSDSPAHAALTVEKLGALSARLCRDWLQRSAHVSVRPVLTLDGPSAAVVGEERAPVDRHDPPTRMREEVVLRDGHCVFPGCSVDSRRCDLDHVEPYLDPGAGGPPGQTSPENLACLCRRHHRLKTFAGWTYGRARFEEYVWHGPHGLTRLAAPSGASAPRRD